MMREKEEYGFLGLTDDADAADVVEQFTIEYMLSLLQQRARHGVDGLSKVIRRIIYVIHQLPKKKVYNHTGRIMDYHPSGDTSISESITKLMQPWINAIPLLSHQGGIGSYSGGSASADRYLEGVIAQFAKDVFITPSFEKTLTMIPVSGESFNEPDYFVPKVPTAFIMGSNVTAKGFRTKAPQYNFDDVCELVKYLSEHILEKKTIIDDHHLSEMSRYLVPDPPSHAHLRNRNQIISGIKEGNFDIPLAFDGIMDIGKSFVIIKSIPPGYPFGKVDKNFKELIKNKKSWLYPIQENYNDETDRKSSIMWAKARIELKRMVSVFEYLQKFKTAIGFSQNNTYNYKWLYKGRLIHLNPIEMLKLWANERMNNISSEYTHNIKSKIENNRKLKALIKIKDHTDEVIKIIKNSSDIPTADKALANRFEMSIYQASAITSMRTGELTKGEKQDLIERERKSINEIKELNKAFKTIPERMFKEADYLQNKYKSVSGRRSRFSNFGFYLQITTKHNTGYIQIDTIEDLETKLKDFDNTDISISCFSKGVDYKYILMNDEVVDELVKDVPKESMGKLIVSPNKLKYTVKLENGTIFYLTDLHNTSNSVFVSDNVLLVDKTGVAKSVKTSTLPLRKNINATGNMTDVKYVHNVPGKQYYIVYVDPREKNVLRITRMTTNESVIKQISRKTRILVVNKMTQSLALTLPDDIINRLKTKYVYIKDLRPLFDKSDHIVLNVKSLKKKKSILLG